MSISPIDVQNCAPSSSQASAPNSSSCNGSDLLRISCSPPLHQPDVESLQISESFSEYRVTSGSLARNAAATGTPCKKVREAKVPNGKGTLLQSNATNLSKVHEPSVKGVGPVRSTERLSDPHVLLHNQAASASLGSRPGRKSQTISGNYLLNFQYDPISRHVKRSPAARHLKKRWKPYNKDLFLQANYKFVVLDCGQYTAENIGPDKELQWEDVICVKFSTSHPVQCPICLDYPLCPQIASCGHIFCFPCILQYMLIEKEDLDENFSKKCPLCFIQICPKDFYTIQIESVKEHDIGDIVDFLFLTRKKNSYAPIASEKHPNNVESGNNEAYTSFSNYIITSDVDLSVREGVLELESWLVKADSGHVEDIERLPYVCAALEHLGHRREYWKERKANCKINSFESSLSERAVPYPVMNVGMSQEKDLSTKQQTEQLDNGYGSYQNTNTNKLPEIEKNDLQEDIDAFSFYQVADGQNLILHPLNMKCLLRYYGVHNMLPSRIRGKILQLETVSQSEAVRRRYRYLSHLSLTTTFQFCEIDLSQVLPCDALVPFMDEIKMREKQRKRVARKEEADRVRAEVAAAHAMAQDLKFSPPCHNPPAFSLDDFEALGNSAPVSSSPPDAVQRPLFSRVTKLGFAADSSSVTGSSIRSSTSFADVIARERTVESVEVVKESGKKGKKPARVLMSTTGGRRY